MQVSSDEGVNCPSLVGFVMEAGGANLQQYLATNKLLHFSDKFRVAVDLLHIVKAAHDNNISLCDFKPANVVYVSDQHDIGRFVGIDLDGACALNASYPVSEIVSTPAYTHPMLERERRASGGLSHTPWICGHSECAG